MKFEGLDSERDADVIDKALYALMDSLDGKLHDVDISTDIVFDVIGGMVDEGEIDDIPDEKANEEEKSAWLSVALPKIRNKIHLIELEPEGE